MTTEAYGRAKNGQYHEWDCLNRWYGLRDLEFFDIIEGGVLFFKGAFDINRVMADYASQPGISVVEPDFFLPPPLFQPATLCARQEGSAIHYFFHQGFTGPGFWQYVSDFPGAVPREVPPSAAAYNACLESIP